MNMRARFAMTSVACAAAAGVFFGGAAPAQADTVHVVQKTRYWSDNATYYEYGPFRDAQHCETFARSNPALSPLFVSNRAICWAAGVNAGAAWYLNAPINVL
ncbi:hypothetical protein [Gordonia rubripertincta]|uniref:Uncharacterized protein n=1 Tax=Gordonia rubripertincta TaxID=36822 RepID=A0ABT4N5M6_GORRU|nr:hypothetical protein [Gordonia rubripertincta]MCZ4553666.1 hypothetical protein [Gordonia rubripertincta]